MHSNHERHVFGVMIVFIILTFVECGVQENVFHLYH